MKTPTYRDWPRRNQSEIAGRHSRIESFLNVADPDVAAKAYQYLPSVNYVAGKDVLRTNTERTYRGPQREYFAFGASVGLDPLAPQPDFWAKYFVGLSDRGLKISTIQVHAAAICKLFDVHGLPSPTRTPFHHTLMQTLNRRDRRAIRKAQPLAREDAARLIQSYKGDDLRTLRDLAVAAFGTIRGWRSATIVGLRLEYCTFEQRGVSIELRNEKNIRNGECITAATPHSADHQHCLPCILRRYVRALRRLGIEEGPVFRRLDRWGNISTDPLTTKAITFLLRRGLSNAGVPNPKSYSSHSYRHGLVQSAINQHWSFADIMSVTLHRSYRGLQPYLRLDPWRNAPKRSLFDEFPPKRKAGNGWSHHV